MVEIKRKPKRYFYGKSLGLFLLGYSVLDGLREFLLTGWQQLAFIYYLTLSVIGVILWSTSSYFERRWEKNPL